MRRTSLASVCNVLKQQIIGQIMRIGAALALTASLAKAEPKATEPRNACAGALRTLQEKEQAGQLRDARDAALACAQPTCTRAVSLQCSTAYTRLENEIPSVTFVATDANGNTLVEVEVRMDGTLLASSLDGRAFPIDPGMHEFVFTTSGHPAQTEKLMVAQGQRNRLISLSLNAQSARKPSVASPAPQAQGDASPVAESAPPKVVATSASAIYDEPSERKRSAWPYIIGGAGLASLGASVALVTWGRQDNELLDRCSPNCSQDSVDHVKNLYLAADITLGVGVVALGTATWLYFTDSGSEPAPADRAGLTVDVKPTRAGAFGSVTGAF